MTRLYIGVLAMPCLLINLYATIVFNTDLIVLYIS